MFIEVFFLAAAVAYLWVAKIVLLGIWRRRVPGWKVWFTVVLVVTVAIPTGDIVLGRIILNEVCSDGGFMQVNKVIELNSKYFTEDGKPRFLGENDDFLPVRLDNRFRIGRETIKYHYLGAMVQRFKMQLVEIETSEIVGEIYADYVDNGWIMSWLSSGGANPRVSCRNMPRDAFSQLFSEVFKIEETEKSTQEVNRL